MRAAVKLAIIVMLAMAIQIALERHIGRLDLAAFRVRMFIAYARGYPPDHPENIADATRLLQRQCERDARAMAATQPAATQPVWEELEP